MLQDVGLSLGYNPGRKLQSLVARLNNNLTVSKSRVSAFFSSSSCFLSFYYQNQWHELAIYSCITFWVTYSLTGNVQSGSGQGLTILHVHVLTRVPFWIDTWDGHMRELGLFGVQFSSPHLRAHWWWVSGEFDLVTFSSLLSQVRRILRLWFVCLRSFVFYVQSFAFLSIYLWHHYCMSLPINASKIYIPDYVKGVLHL